MRVAATKKTLKPIDKQITRGMLIVSAHVTKLKLYFIFGLSHAILYKFCF